jgi:NAD(P)-dependent dehydrogenase (short-subunit alcohol dehydrogenase family)
VIPPPDPDTPLATLWSLDSRVAVITGGGSGMGRATALRLAEAGAAVVVADHSLPAAQETAELVTSRYPHARARAAHVDVASSELVRDLAQRVADEFGRLDIWVNTAWVSSSASILGHPDEPWRQGLDVNLSGAFHCAREAARWMVPAGRGVIVLVTSGSAHRGRPRRYQYAAAKHGTLGLVRSLALELGPAGVRVLAVAPTTTDSPGLRLGRRDMTEADRAQAAVLLEQTVSRIALGRLGHPDDVARAVTFAVSDVAEFMTGSTIHADGGYDAS